MTYIVRLTRNTPENLDHAIWRGQRALERGYTKWKVESPKGELLAAGP